MPQPSQQQPDWATEERQIALLARAVAHMPHPGRHEVDVPIPAGSRNPFAERLYRKGVRIFPDLAQVETVTAGEEQMGAYAAAVTLPIDEARLWKLLRAQDPNLYDRIRNAETPDQRAAIAAELGPQAGQDINRIMAMIEQVRGTL
ncbi:hypothetical protein B1R94_25925 [Mycolicibacterium litorale]|nr:hypothetical protein B1R94_25925 [Mycolicibacterium litorale]